jgi:preprotein translocase subunit SecG
MKLKRMTGLLAALLFAFAMVACSSNNATPAPAAESAAPAAESPAG